MHMKVTLEQISGGVEEIIIKYREMTEQIEGIVNYINQNEKKLFVSKDGQQVALPPQNVISRRYAKELRSILRSD